MQVVAPGHRTELPPCEDPCHGRAPERLTDDGGVVPGAAVRGAEQVRPAAVAGEQQRSGGRLAVRRQMGAQVGVGGVGVAHLQAHRLADLDPVADHETTRGRVDAEDGAHQEVVVLGILVDRDPEREPGGGERLLVRWQVGEQLLDPGRRGQPREAGEDVARRAGHGHRRPDRPTALADQGARRGALQHHADRAAVDRTAVQEQPGRARPARAVREPPDDREPWQRRVGLRGEALGREAVGIGQQQRHLVALVHGQADDGGPCLGAHDLEVEGPQPHPRQDRGQHRDRTPTALDAAAFDAAPAAQDPAGAAADEHAGTGGRGDLLSDRCDVLGVVGAHEDRHEVRHRLQRGERRGDRGVGGGAQVGTCGKALPEARHPRSLTGRRPVARPRQGDCAP